MVNSVRNLLTQLPVGPCRCATPPDGKPWVDPADTDRWADDGGRNSDGECNFIGKCPRCGGKYRIVIDEVVVDDDGRELGTVGSVA
ncbi:unnamed protein product [Gemmata massiliana]|uniref:Uncharacterized protein n=1 Tax=Gemmata massiliana TaxID=1210884 RepID=A0A6P2D9A7_9BACT|nr:hypothetical protein [Gemmata massiliana]VTR97931.1 unnamed protein product [Gemmata massiliana]